AKEAQCAIDNQSPPSPIWPKLIDGTVPAQALIKQVREGVQTQGNVNNGIEASRRILLNTSDAVAAAYSTAKRAAAHQAVQEFRDALLDLCRRIIAVDSQFTEQEQQALDQIFRALSQDSHKTSSDASFVFSHVH